MQIRGCLANGWFLEMKGIFSDAVTSGKCVTMMFPMDTLSDIFSNITFFNIRKKINLFTCHAIFYPILLNS